jgi:hypothetical protein
MRNSPLIRTLQLLNKEEFEALHYFVSSPIFNERNRFQDTLALFEYLRPYFPDFDSAVLSRENAGAVLFPERKSKEDEVNKAMTQLMNVLRQFIIFRHFAVRDGKTVRKSAQKSFSEDPILLLNFARQQVALMHFYRNRIGKKARPEAPAPIADNEKRTRKTDHFFDILHEDLLENMNAQTDFQRFENPEFDEYHLFRYLGEYEKFKYDSLVEQRGQDHNILAAMRELDRFYLLSKLDFMIRMAHFMTMTTVFPPDSEEGRQWETNAVIMRQFMKEMEMRQYLQEPTLQLQCQMLYFLLEQNPPAADPKALEAARLLQSYGHQLPAERATDYRVILRAYWGRRYGATRDERLLEHSFELMRHQLEADGPEKPIQSSHYVNCVLIALHLGKLDWAKDFIEQVGDRVEAAKEPGLVREIIAALLAFESNDFTRAAAALPHYFNYSALDDIFHYAIAATLDVRIRYELNKLDEDEALSMLKATRAFIEREKKLPPHRKAERLLFFKIAEKMYKLRQKMQLKKADVAAELNALQEILDTQPVVDKKWLNAKLQELQALKLKINKGLHIG